MSATKETLRLYLTSEQISEVVQKLAKEISAAYTEEISKGTDLIVIVTLKGALFFAADLLRHLDIPVQVDFIRVASYGKETKSGGTVKLLRDLETDPTGRHVLILDEIVDSGRTIDFLVKKVWAASPKSLKVCALLDKPSRREVDVNVDFTGLAVEDKFLVGYGLDFEERYRNLPSVYYFE
jgi:hypoxanthine phosphoribosyltransferase